MPALTPTPSAASISRPHTHRICAPHPRRPWSLDLPSLIRLCFLFPLAKAGVCAAHWQSGQGKGVSHAEAAAPRAGRSAADRKRISTLNIPPRQQAARGGEAAARRQGRHRGGHRRPQLVPHADQTGQRRGHEGPAARGAGGRRRAAAGCGAQGARRWRLGLCPARTPLLLPGSLGSCPPCGPTSEASGSAVWHQRRARGCCRRRRRRAVDVGAWHPPCEQHPRAA